MVPTPSIDGRAASRSLSGCATAETLQWARVGPGSLLALALALALAAYLGAASRVRRRWPPARTVSFVSAAVVVVVALALDGEERFTAHAVQHLLLGMVAPALFALAAPVTLALQASGPPLRRRLLRALHSRAASVAGHPLTGWSLFGGSMLALYLTPLYRLALDHAWLHEVLHVHFLVAGALFLWPIVGVDPVPQRLPHGARLLTVFLTVPFHAVLGMALLGAGDPLAPQHTLADHRAGAGVLWVAGDLLGLVAALVVAAQWMAHDDRQAAREDRRAERASPVLD